MEITKGRVVVMDYTLTSDDGTVLDASQNGEFVYLHGADNIIIGLESALEGKQAGDELKVHIEPADAYGARDPDRVQKVPHDMFEAGADIQPGMQFHAQSPDGHMMVITVASIEEDGIVIDGNHALAGVSLNFEVKVLDVRDATEDEMAHGHVHAAGGCGH